MNKFFIILLLIFPIISSAFASEHVTVYENSTSGNNVTVNINEEKSLDNAIMISSGIIIGFVGFSTILEMSKISEFVRQRVLLLWMNNGVIGLLITLHLIVIMLVFEGDLDSFFYHAVIIMTIFAVLTIIIIMSYLFRWHAWVEEETHNERVGFNSFVEQKQKEITGKEKFIGPLDNLDKKSGRN